MVDRIGGGGPKPFDARDLARLDRAVKTAASQLQKDVDVPTGVDVKRGDPARAAAARQSVVAGEAGKIAAGFGPKGAADAPRQRCARGLGGSGDAPASPLESLGQMAEALAGLAEALQAGLDVPAGAPLVIGGSGGHDPSTVPDAGQPGTAGGYGGADPDLLPGAGQPGTAGGYGGPDPDLLPGAGQPGTTWGYGGPDPDFM